MIIIASAAFIEAEFSAEIGRIPSSFVPIGNTRLYEYQIKRLSEAFPSEKVYLTLPEEFEVPHYDMIRLKELQVGLITAPSKLSLNSSILYTIKSLNIYDGPVRQLHGDTLISKFPPDVDVIGLGLAHDGYAWEFEDHVSGKSMVWCGYFAFSNINLLEQALIKSGDNYTRAVREYGISCKMQLILMDGWLDFGHVNTYYRSRESFTTQRSFNRLLIKNGVVRKSSSDGIKISVEAQWYLTLPPSLRKYVPQLIQVSHDLDEQYYEIEYLPHPNLGELFVFGALPVMHWSKIIYLAEQLLEDFVSAVHISPESMNRIRYDFSWLVTEKTRLRLGSYQKSTGRSMYEPHSINGQTLPCLEEIVAHCAKAVGEQDEIQGVSHGDFCFSNILYDSRQDRLKLIDPRGLAADSRHTIFGDVRYDMAKLAQSVVGLYDYILSGHYELKIQTPYDFELTIHMDQRSKTVTEKFLASNLLGRSVVETLPLVVLLFLGMLPLHADDKHRQVALYANAMRVYAIWQEF